MRKSFRRTQGALTELNVTPLLDLVFSLLIIFIIITPQLSNDLELSLPTGEPPANAEPPPPPHRVTVGHDRALAVNGRPYALADLREVFTGLRAAEADPGVVVLGGPDVDYARVIEVLDLLQQCDVTRVGLATETTP